MVEENYIAIEKKSYNPHLQNNKSNMSIRRLQIFIMPSHLLFLFFLLKPRTNLSSAFTLQSRMRFGSSSSSSSRLFETAVPKLDSWILLPTGSITGTIYNPQQQHESTTKNTIWTDGDEISTSPLIDPETATESALVETISGSKYFLMKSAGASSSTDGVVIEGSSTSKVKNLMEKVKDAGIAGAISYAFWELGFWTLSVPVCLFAYRSLFGHWPDLSNQDDISLLGTEAFAFVNVARFAVPIRITLALSTTPWIQANIVDRFSNRNQ